MFFEEGNELNASEEAPCEGEEAVNKSSKHRRNNPRKGQGQARTQPNYVISGAESEGFSEDTSKLEGSRTAAISSRCGC
jgi:hypothetical protein